MIERSRDEPVEGPFADENGTTLADRSLKLLGIESSEKQQYQYTDVSKLLA